MAKIKHADRKHALLSASGASRWINCTPSPRLEEQFEESATSSFAAEGTLAHEFGDLALKSSIEVLSKKDSARDLEILRKHPLYTDEMEEQVHKYVSYVLEEFTAAKLKTIGALLLIEEKVDLTHFIEEGFGTNDAIVIADGTMEVIDLKYGKGIRVDAEDNSQLKLYGLGALRAYELLYDIHTVKMTIHQPRLDHISSAEISAVDLNTWGEDIVKPKAKLAYAGEGEQIAGSWCQWCKVKARCAALAGESLKMAKHDFKKPQLLTDKQLLEVYKQIPGFTGWASAVKDYILAEAIAGKKWKGYKLVEGRSNRKWVDDVKVAAQLLKLKFAPEKFMVSKLGGITLIEKLVGKDKFQTILGSLVVKPQGAPTIAEESDKRPAMGIEQAKVDFK